MTSLSARCEGAHLRNPRVQQQRPLVASASRRGGSVGSLRSTSSPIALLSLSSASARPRPASGPASTTATGTTKPRRRPSVAARAGTPTKPMPAWDGIYDFMRKKNLETVSPSEAFALASTEGWVIVDVRPRKRHEQSAPDLGGDGGGVASVPLYDTPDFSKPSLSRYLRAAILASQGVAPVEQNEEFVERVLALLSSSGGNKKGVLMLCEVGGSLTPTASFPTGKTSRSLQAAFRALEAGVESAKVKHVGGGCFAYQQEGLPMTAEYDASGVGRTPGIVSQEQRKKK